MALAARLEFVLQTDGNLGTPQAIAAIVLTYHNRAHNIMPVLNLKTADGDLHPLASFKVLALMCHPTDTRDRQTMMALIQRGTGVGMPRAAALTNDGFLREVTFRGNRGLVAGALLLTLIQLDENGYRASLNRAIPLIKILLDKWVQLEEQFWTPDCHIGHKPHSRRRMLSAFNDYLTVAHLWAALLHGGQQEREDIWPGSPKTLPTFLAYANSFLRMGQKLTWAGRARHFTLPSKNMWTIVLPAGLKEIRQVKALPLYEEQKAALPG